MTILRRLWMGIPVPKPITLAYVVAHLAVTALGVVSLFEPPGSIRGAWGTTVTTIWTMFLICGGIAGALACLTGKWLIEKPAIILSGTGIAMYVSVLGILYFSNPPSRLFTLIAQLIVLDLLFIRYMQIHRYSYEPGR